MPNVEVKVNFQSLLEKIEYDLDTYRIENTSIDSPKESKIILETLHYALNVVRDVIAGAESDIDFE